MSSTTQQDNSTCPFCQSHYVDICNRRLKLNGCGHYICQQCQQDLYQFDSKTQLSCPSCQQHSRRTKSSQSDEENSQTNQINGHTHAESHPVQRNNSKSSRSSSSTHSSLTNGRQQRLQMGESLIEFNEQVQHNLQRCEVVLTKINDIVKYLNKIKKKAEIEAEDISNISETVNNKFNQEFNHLDTLLLNFELRMGDDESLLELENYLVQYESPAVSLKLSDYSIVDETSDKLETVMHREESETDFEDLENAEMSLITFDSCPIDLCVLEDVRGDYGIEDGIVTTVSSSNYSTIPSPSMLVLLNTNDLLLMDMDGQSLAQLQPDINCPSLQSIDIWQQLLVLSDVKNHCLHLTDLSGCPIHRSRDNIVKQPRGVKVHFNNVYCCDYGADTVLIMTLPSFEPIRYITDQISRPAYPIIIANNSSTSFLLVSNCDTTGSMAVYCIVNESTTLIDVVHGLVKPTGLASNQNSSMVYVCDRHRVNEINLSTLQIQNSRGFMDTKGPEVEEFNTPMGMDIIRLRNNDCRLLICDTNNYRIKVYHLL